MGEDDERFLAIGADLVADLIGLCGLREDSTVLDIGSGYGRVAHALWRQGHTGDYLGLDILPQHVGWCRQTITPFTENRMRFALLDIKNARYNPTGSIPADTVTFDIRDGTIDVAVLTSVFTHMYPGEVRRYLGEVRRMLAPAGRALATFFALDDGWREVESIGRSALPMRHDLEPGVRYHDAGDPLHAIGYTPTWIHRSLADSGLRVYACALGDWCGRAASRGYQDTFILEIPQDPGS